jgi:hypothetical protein
MKCLSGRLFIFSRDITVEVRYSTATAICPDPTGYFKLLCEYRVMKMRQYVWFSFLGLYSEVECGRAFRK